MLELNSLVINESRLLDDALKVVLSVRTSWTTDSVNSKVFTDGITNKLVGFWTKDDNAKEDMLLVRVYGQVRNVVSGSFHHCWFTSKKRSFRELTSS